MKFLLAVDIRDGTVFSLYKCFLPLKMQVHTSLLLDLEQISIGACLSMRRWGLK